MTFRTKTHVYTSRPPTTTPARPPTTSGLLGEPLGLLDGRMKPLDGSPNRSLPKRRRINFLRIVRTRPKERRRRVLKKFLYKLVFGADPKQVILRELGRISRKELEKALARYESEQHRRESLGEADRWGLKRSGWEGVFKC
jgi:hypothetical protein